MLAAELATAGALVQPPPRRRQSRAEVDALRAPAAALLSPLGSSPQSQRRRKANQKAWGAALTIPTNGLVPPTPSPVVRLGARGTPSPGRRRALRSAANALEVVSMQKKTKEHNLKEASMRDPAFKEIVGKYWQAMTDNGKLPSVNFSLYNLVHMRISKTLEPEFTEEEAREVAEEDFKSDTAGKLEMKRTQLYHSLYELACVWAKAQMDQSGLTCETQHLVYFLTQMFKNIAEELIIEARRVVKLKEMQDITVISNFIADGFRLAFKVDAAKQRMLNLAAKAAAKRAAAEQAERLREEEAEEAERMRQLGEARRRAEERAAWRREMAWYQEELNEWTRLLHAAKARVGQAQYELGCAEELSREQRKELESLMRTQVQLALSTGGQLVPGGPLFAVRERWERLSHMHAATESRIGELASVLEEAKAALATVPPQPKQPIFRSRGPMTVLKGRRAWAC